MVMVKVDSLFYELLQVSLGNREKLSRNPNDEEWAELFEISKKQTVAGLTFAALDRLSGVGQKPPLPILYEWIGVSEQIRQRNRFLNNRCCQLQRIMEEKNIRSSILKGQGIALYYDTPLQKLRQPGDIDIFVDCGREKAIEIAKQCGVEKPEWDYKHLHFNIWPDTEVEIHYRIEVLLNLWKNRKLQKWFKDHEEGLNLDHNVNHNDITTPSVEFNRFYILLHIYRHFLYEGIGFRQIIDYYFVLKTSSNVNISNQTDNLILTLQNFGMMKFARGLMWVMNEPLGMPDAWMICESDEKEGRYLLNQIMASGNFGHYDERLKVGQGKIGAIEAILKHNWHLLWHYPSDVIWAPIWIVWHKLWKLTRR